MKEHGFFRQDAWQWDNIRGQVSPVVPELQSDIDSQYFDVIDDEKEKPESFATPRVSGGVEGVKVVQYARHCVCFAESIQMSGNFSVCVRCVLERCVCVCVCVLIRGFPSFPPATGVCRQPPSVCWLHLLQDSPPHQDREGLP